MSTVSIKGNKSKKKVISSLEGSRRHRNKNQQEGGVIVTMIGRAAEAGKTPQARPYKGGDVDYSLNRTALGQ